jgi:hypothetical protein
MSTPPISPFIVENLTAKNPTGAQTTTYELSRLSVSPSRIAGRGPLGPIEETVPTVHWANFLMLDGCVNKVPLRTGSVYSEQADAKSYENEITTELVSLGCIPAHLCPYSSAMGYITRGPFVTPPDGERECGGSGHPQGDGKGCKHLQDVAALRKAEVMRKYNAEQEMYSKMRDEEINRLREGIVLGVGEAIAANMPAQANAAARKQALKDGATS